ncbi:hypothetical protein AHiyo8_47910 [Arthrobacter sp. Hiyo8]|nr:hypothetical protein AHiyo8_47910 [Arthrobacter sp. Hiyo8]
MAFELIGGRKGFQDFEQAGPLYQGVRSERSTTLSPSSADTGMTATSAIPSLPKPSSRATFCTSVSISRKTDSLKSTRSILFTATITCATRSNCSTDKWRRVCSRTPLRASMSTTTASAVDAPVTVFLVY